MKYKLKVLVIIFVQVVQTRLILFPTSLSQSPTNKTGSLSTDVGRGCFRWRHGSFLIFQFVHIAHKMPYLMIFRTRPFFTVSTVHPSSSCVVGLVYVASGGWEAVVCSWPSFKSENNFYLLVSFPFLSNGKREFNCRLIFG